AGAVYTLMSTWRRGEELLATSLAPVPVASFLRELAERPPVRVPGVAVFLSAHEGALPHEILHFMRRIGTVPDRLVLMVVSTVDLPRIAEAERIRVRKLDGGIVQVSARYGFMESPDVPRALERSAALEGVRLEEVTFFVGQVTPVKTDRPGLARWRK